MEKDMKLLESLVIDKSYWVANSYGAWALRIERVDIKKKLIYASTVTNCWGSQDFVCKFSNRLVNKIKRIKVKVSFSDFLSHGTLYTNKRKAERHVKEAEESAHRWCLRQQRAGRLPSWSND